MDKNCNFCVEKYYKLIVISSYVLTLLSSIFLTKVSNVALKTNFKYSEIFLLSVVINIFASMIFIHNGNIFSLFLSSVLALIFKYIYDKNKTK